MYFLVLAANLPHPSTLILTRPLSTAFPPTRACAATLAESGNAYAPQGGRARLHQADLACDAACVSRLAMIKRSPRSAARRLSECFMRGRRAER